MELKHIKTDSCPVCGNKNIIKEERKGKHSNGEDFEVRGFDCGFVISYVPNFTSERISTYCPKSPHLIEKAKKREVFKDYLLEFIDKGEVDADFKDSLKRNLILSV